MLDVCILGTSGKVPLPNRRLSSCTIRVNGSVILFDCGEGTQVGLRDYAIPEKRIDVICITHYHADHVAGLAGVLLAIANAGRTEPVTIIGPAGLGRIINATRVFASTLPFEIKLVVLAEDMQTIEFNDFTIKAFKVIHGVTCYGYSLELGRRPKFSVEKAESNEVPRELWTPLSEGAIMLNGGKVYTPEMVLTDPRKGIKVVYCTDTRPCKQINDFAENADLLILEGMYPDGEYMQKAIDSCHMLFSEAAYIAKKACVKELWLTHFCQMIANPNSALENATNVFKNTKAAHDGMSTTLNYEE